MLKIKTQAILTCPECGTKQKVIMPLHGRQRFFKCSNDRCSADIFAKENEHCVFCKYSNESCPEIQQNPNKEQKSKLHSLI